MSATPEDMMAALAGVPALPGARCRGRSWLFDPATPGETQEAAAQRHLKALSLCGQCPAREKCISWFQALPKSQRPVGVIAGRIHLQRGKSND